MRSTKKSVLSLVKTTRLRRVKFVDQTIGWHWHTISIYGPPINQFNMLKWIYTHTKGRFFLTSYKVAFENETDFLLFSLSWDYEKLTQIHRNP